MYGLQSQVSINTIGFMKALSSCYRVFTVIIKMNENIIKRFLHPIKNWEAKYMDW